jgi:hypothetical protein
MKILHLSTELSWRGGEQQIIYLHEELLRLKIQSIVACREGSVVAEYCTVNKIPHVVFNLRI